MIGGSAARVMRCVECQHILVCMIAFNYRCIVGQTDASCWCALSHLNFSSAPWAEAMQPSGSPYALDLGAATVSSQAKQCRSTHMVV
eukprot:COSAG02_NODE_16_length_56207_cov_9.816122_3_plen_87_part_00